MAEANI